MMQRSMTWRTFKLPQIHLGLFLAMGFMNVLFAQTLSPPLDSASKSSQEEIDSIESIEIIANSLSTGSQVGKDSLSSNVQTATGAQMENTGALNLADFLQNNFTSVHLNDNQGNPFQMDLNFRGFTASPLLGTPQGLSVYVDGVRMNQPFGDIVQWDLIPNSAIKDISLFAGSNPVFGANTLGGALSITTKDGMGFQGTELETAMGSFGRRSIELESGKYFENGLHTYLNYKDFLEKGWRDHSPTNVQQLFGKLGWHARQTDIKISLSHFSSQLTGNGLQQEQLLQQNYASVFTQPDLTQNKSTVLNLEVEHALNEDWSLSANTFWRRINTSTTNADLNTNALGEKVYGYSSAEGNWLMDHQLLSPGSSNSAAPSAQGNGFPYLRCLAQAGLNTEPNEKCNALINHTQSRQSSWGTHVQLNSKAQWAGLPNRLTLGASVDLSESVYAQQTQFAYLTPERTAQGVNAFADGSQNSETAFDQRVQLKGQSLQTNLLLMDTLTLAEEKMHMNAAGLWSNTRIENKDLLFPYASNYSALATSAGLERGSLGGTHTFNRFNPAVGLSYTPSAQFNPFMSYSESSRAPTSIELGCADPQYDCRLPNAMAGDPPLKQVVTKTWEVGARGKSKDGKLQWNGAFFRAQNSDDILFVASSTHGGSGYFKNFGQTQRQGFEMGLKGAHKEWTFGLHFTQMQATYQSPETVISSLNPMANALGQIQVMPGNALPLMPSRLMNARMAYAFSPTFKSGLSMNAVDSSFARGNENNLPLGKIPGFAILNWSGSWKWGEHVMIYTQILNLMDKKYSSSGALGNQVFSSGGQYNNTSSGTLYEAPGAPRSFNIKVRFELE